VGDGLLGHNPYSSAGVGSYKN